MKMTPHPHVPCPSIHSTSSTAFILTENVGYNSSEITQLHAYAFASQENVFVFPNATKGEVLLSVRYYCSCVFAFANSHNFLGTMNWKT